GGMTPLSVAWLREPHSLEDRNSRPVGQERRGWRPVQVVGESLSVEPGGVALEARIDGRPRAPARMLDLVFQGASTPPTRVAPVVLRDEFLLATGRDLTRLASHGDTEPIFSPLESPSIGHLTYGRGALAGHGDAVTHRDGDVVLAVENPGRDGNGRPRHQLLDEDNGASPALARPPPDVEAQVHLLEVAMPGNSDSENPRVEKQKPDQADKCPPAPVVELCPGWDQWTYDRRIDLEVQHRQMAPLGSQEDGPGVSHPVSGPPDGPHSDEDEADSRDVAEVPGLDMTRDCRAGQHTDGGSGDEGQRGGREHRDQAGPCTWGERKGA